MTSVCGKKATMWSHAVVPRMRKRRRFATEAVLGVQSSTITVSVDLGQHPPRKRMETAAIANSMEGDHWLKDGGRRCRQPMEGINPLSPCLVHSEEEKDNIEGEESRKKRR
uniref:Uncharacterized protein n=1 Tax=Oryza sativa subsp. japonica TaxID=39947 RepID=Q6ETQ1_ORYSJ|nr:hypothetical protein [Oryza sativa Japonica Group]